MAALLLSAPARRRIATLPALLAAVFALSSCGGSNDVKEPAKLPPANFADNVKGPVKGAVLAAQDYVTAINAGDGTEICHLTSMNKKTLATCQQQLSSSFDARIQTSYKLLTYKLTGPDSAVVRIVQTKPPPRKGYKQVVTYFRLKKVDGEWKVAIASLG